MGVRLLAWVVFVGAMAVACGSEATEPTTTLPAAPDIVVREWLDAVTTGNVPSLERLVASESLAFVVGIESRLGTDDITALADDGLPEEVVAGFWSSFADAFAAIDGNAFAALDVGAVDEFDTAGARFAAVTLGIDERSVDVLVRRSPDGRWEVDVLGTVAEGLTVQLRDLAAQATADRFRTLFEQWVFPALEAAARNDVDGRLIDSVREIRIAFDSAGR